MTRTTSPPGYAPLPLVPDPDRFGLTESRIDSVAGTIVARSRRTGRSGRATLFLHGAAGSWTTWTPLLATAEAESVPIANPVLFDLPGWGDGVLTDEGARDTLDAISLLVRESAEALGFTEWDLVGHSMGGFVALHMATLWPECVLSVGVISATSWSVIDATEHPVRNFGRAPGFVLLWRLMQFLAALGTSGRRIPRALDRLHVLRAAVSPLFRHPTRIPRSVIHALAVEVRPRSFAAAARLARGYDASGRWAKIECPVRAVRGNDDIFASARDLDLLDTTLPNSHA
jgi:pimeloyl-ACP methyl ester carboxylesterase